MRNLIKEIPLGLKIIAIAAVATTSILLMPNGKPDTTKHGNFKYHTGISDTTTINQPQPKKGLRTSEETGINDTGEHRTPNSDESNYAIYIDVSIDHKPNKISVAYSHRPKSNSSEIEQVREHLEEDPNNTHIYFILPKKLQTGKFTQTTRILNNKHPRGTSVGATPTNESRLNLAVRKYNQLFSTDQSSPEISELEAAARNSAKMLGEKGKFIELTIDGFKIILNEQEAKRIETLKQKYGNSQIIKMPFHQGARTLGNIIIGRSTTLKIDESSIREATKAYISIPKITFSRGSKRANIEGLAYELEIGELKLKTKTDRQIPLTEIILGEWESHDPFNAKDHKAETIITKDTMTEIVRGGKTGYKKIIRIIKKIRPIDSNSCVGITAGTRNYNRPEQRIRIFSKNLIGILDYLFKRKGIKAREVKSTRPIHGTWREINPDPNTNLSRVKDLTYKITEDYINASSIMSNGKSNVIYETERVQQIGRTYLIYTRKRGSNKKQRQRIIFTPNGKKLIVSNKTKNIPLKRIK